MPYFARKYPEHPQNLCDNISWSASLHVPYSYIKHHEIGLKRINAMQTLFNFTFDQKIFQADIFIFQQLYLIRFFHVSCR